MHKTFWDSIVELLLVSFMLFLFLHFVITMGHERRPATPPIPEYHRLPLPDDFFNNYVSAVGTYALAPKPTKVGEAIVEEIRKAKKRKKAHRKPSEPSSGAPVETPDIMIIIEEATKQ